MTERKKQSSGIGRTITVAAATVAAIAAAGPVQANNVVDEIGHFIECFGWMLTDPATQVANCGAGRPQVGLASLAEQSTAAAPLVVTGPTGGSSSSGSGGSGTGGSGTGSPT